MDQKKKDNIEMRILFATRAMESPLTEGGFVLLSDLARAVAKEPGFEVAMLSVNSGQKYGIQCLGGYSGPGRPLRAPRLRVGPTRPATRALSCVFPAEFGLVT